MAKPTVTDLNDGRILITTSTHPHISIWISECDDMLRMSTPDPVVWDKYEAPGGHKGYLIYPEPDDNDS